MSRERRDIGRIKRERTRHPRAVERGESGQTWPELAEPVRHPEHGEYGRWCGGSASGRGTASLLPSVVRGVLPEYEATVQFQNSGVNSFMEIFYRSKPVR